MRSPAIALLQICDVFEALTAVRPYKQAMDHTGIMVKHLLVNFLDAEL